MATAYYWASAEVLSTLFEAIDSLLSDLPIESVERLTELVVSRTAISERSFDEVILPSSWQRQVPITSPTLVLFFHRLGDGPQKDRILTKKAMPGLHPGFAACLLRYAWNRWINGFLTDRQIAAINKKFYRPRVFTGSRLDVPSSIDRRALRPAWEMLLKQSDGMPDAVLMAAEGELRRMSKRPKPVMRVADKEKWFL
ncbi:hypothetical protein [Streptomyces scabiei]|uniref:hypothetical protein n=1 Tax=Streptomyces scabiei TaxID=1930 RepID=UPI00117E02CF|nr:hypothetical protein [Streptomyces scabiei]